MPTDVVKPVPPPENFEDAISLLKQQKAALEVDLEDAAAAIAALERDNAELAKNSANKIAELQLRIKASKALPAGDYVVFKGETYQIIGDYRADNTFSEVKRGHCDEGVTLIAIPRVH